MDSNVCLLKEEQRKNPCPIGTQLANDAAQKAIEQAGPQLAKEVAEHMFKLFDFDMNKTEDMRKVRNMIDFLYTVSGNVETSKKIVWNTFTKVVLGLVITVTTFGFSAKWIIILYKAIKEASK